MSALVFYERQLKQPIVSFLDFEGDEENVNIIG